MQNDTQKALATISIYDMFNVVLPKYDGLEDPKVQQIMTWVAVGIAYLPVPLALLIALVF